MTTRERQAQLYYASGYSCEQAVFAAFADILGFSLVSAQQNAPKRRGRGLNCGAYISGVAVLRRIHARACPEDQQDAIPAVAEFHRLFLEAVGITDCAPIMAAHGRLLSDCLDVIGLTARLVERVARKYYGIE